MDPIRGAFSRFTDWLGSRVDAARSGVENATRDLEQRAGDGDPRAARALDAIESVKKKWWETKELTARNIRT